MPTNPLTSRRIYKVQDFSLLEIIGGDTHLELKAKIDGGEFAGFCPFCGGSGKSKSDRFRVWPASTNPRFWCRQCGKKGNVFTYVMYKFNVDFVGAVKILGVAPVERDSFPKSRLADAPPSLSALTDVHISTELVERLHKQNFDMAYHYWKQWHLNEDTMHRFQLGYVNEFVGNTCYHGYTIPHWWTTSFGPALKAVKVRSIEPMQRQKYTCFGSSYPGGVFNDVNTSDPDGSRPGPNLDFCFVTEDERTAMMLDQWYPSVAYFPKTEWNIHLDKVFSHVGMVIILADNDEGPGIERAKQIKSYLGSKDTLILKPSKDKQLSDLVYKEGTDALHTWIEHQIPGIHPIEGRYSHVAQETTAA